MKIRIIKEQVEGAIEDMSVEDLDQHIYETQEALYDAKDDLESLVQAHEGGTEVSRSHMMNAVSQVESLAADLKRAMARMKQLSGG